MAITFQLYPQKVMFWHINDIMIYYDVIRFPCNYLAVDLKQPVFDLNRQKRLWAGLNSSHYTVASTSTNYETFVKYIRRKLKISKYWWSSLSGLNLSVSYVVTEQKLCAQLRVAAIWDYMCRAWNVKWAVKRQPPFILFMASISQFYCLQKSAGELHAPVHEQ